MKLKTALALGLSLAVSSVSALNFQNDEQKIGYAIGYDIGNTVNDIAAMGELDFHALLLGLRDAYEKKDSALNAEEAEAVMQKFVEKQMEKMQAELEEKEKKAAELGEKAKADGKAFLEENKGKEGVQSTASGLQYLVQKEGEGAKPSATDEVKVHYEGRLLDGSVFDSSYERGEAVTFPLNAVIAGWTEGLQLMSVGSKYTFFIPSELAYGEFGAGDDIPPHSTLIFEVELLEINPSQENSEAAPSQG